MVRFLSVLLVALSFAITPLAGVSAAHDHDSAHEMNMAQMDMAMDSGNADLSDCCAEPCADCITTCGAIAMITKADTASGKLLNASRAPFSATALLGKAPTPASPPPISG